MGWKCCIPGVRRLGINPILSPNLVSIPSNDSMKKVWIKKIKKTCAGENL